MSSKGEAKANSTRLPPRVASTRKPSGKQSKAARRKMVERETAEKAELDEKIKTYREKLVEVLSNGGVSENVLEGLRKGLTPKEESDASIFLGQDAQVGAAWALAKCYPSINVHDLVSVLAELRALLCDSASLASKPVHRRADDIRSNPKADPDLLATAERNEMEINVIVTKCNIGAYTTRALQKIVSELQVQ